MKKNNHNKNGIHAKYTMHQHGLPYVTSDSITDSCKLGYASLKGVKFTMYSLYSALYLYRFKLRVS